MSKPACAAALLSAAAVSLAGCTTTAVTRESVGDAALTFADGRPAGRAWLTRDGMDLSIGVSVTGMTPGAHGYHLHTSGRCEAPGFTSAGGHLNPDNRKHGTLADGGAHLGDLPNLQVREGGSATATEPVAGGEAALSAIFDGDGTAVIVHAQPDDYRTDPSGNSGDRVACGVLRRLD